MAKLNRLDRGAVRISTFRQGRVAVGKERARRRSAERSPCRLRWVVREYLPDCHNNFVKRYHWLFG